MVDYEVFLKYKKKLNKLRVYYGCEKQFIKTIKRCFWFQKNLKTTREGFYVTTPASYSQNKVFILFYFILAFLKLLPLKKIPIQTTKVNSKILD